MFRLSCSANRASQSFHSGNPFRPMTDSRRPPPPLGPDVFFAMPVIATSVHILICNSDLVPGPLGVPRFIISQGSYRVESRLRPIDRIILESRTVGLPPGSCRSTIQFVGAER